MNRVYARIVPVALLVLALVPLSFYVYHGQFTRLFSDDYIYLGKALESGTWQAMLFWRESWNGDYTNFLLYGALAPLGARAPALLSTAFIAAGLIGFTWLVSRFCAFFGVSRHRRMTAIALAALIMVAYIYGAYNLWAFYWLTVMVEYSIPVVVLVVSIALGAAAVKRARSGMRLSIAAIAFAALGFVVAGFSEMYLVFQSVTLLLLGFGALVFSRGRERRACILIVAAALAGTAVSLALQMTSPGAQHRLALTEYWSIQIERIYDLPALIVGVAELMPAYLTVQSATSGFKLLAAAGLFVTLTFSRAAPRPPRQTQKAAAPWPYVVAFIVQLAFLPYLWSHSSDSRVIFERFSYSYMLAISVNIALIFAAAAMISRPKRLRDYLNTAPGQLAHTGVVLLIVLALFALPELRSIVYRANLYCWITAFLLAGILLWHLAFNCVDQSDRWAKRIGGLTLWSAVLTVVVLAVLLAVALRAQGFVSDYSVLPVVFPFVITGLLLGASIGVLIRRQLSATKAQTRFLPWAGMLSLLVAAAISWNVVTAQTHMLVDLREGARIWDGTHQEILKLRETDPTAIASREFLFRAGYVSRLYGFETDTRRLSWWEALFYELDYTSFYSE